MPGPRKARIGDILVRHSQLTSQQVSRILAVQEKDGRPFGKLAQIMFGLTTRAIEAAWVDQYLSFETQVDLETQSIDASVLQVVSRRQAWQLQLMPLRREEGCLLVATSEQRLVRSANFVWRRLGEPVLLMVAPAAQLEACLQEHYPWPAMQQSVGHSLVGVGST